MPWPAIAAGVSAAAQGSSDLVSALTGNYQNNRSMHHQQDMQREQNLWDWIVHQGDLNWQSQQTDKQNAWSEAQASTAYERQKELLRMQQDWQSQQNNPAYMMELASKAGLNPSVFMGKGTSNQAAPSSPSVTPASGSAPSTPSMSRGGYAPLQQFALASPFNGNVRDIASALRDIAQSRLNDAEAEFARNSLSSRLRKMNADADFSEAAARHEANIRPLLSTAQAYSAYGSYTESLAHAVELAKAGELHDAEKSFTDVRREHEKVLKSVDEKRRDVLDKELSHWEQEFRARIDNMQADSSAKRSDSAYKSSLYRTEEELRDGRRRLLSADERVRNAEVDKLASECHRIASELIAEGIYGLDESVPHSEQHFRSLLLRRLDADIKSKEFSNTWIGRFMGAINSASGASAGALVLGLMK